MKKSKIFICISLLGILLTGCGSTLLSDHSPEKIPTYSEDTPTDTIPYYKDLGQADVSENIPESFLTISKAEDTFRKLGFASYREEEKDGLLSCTSVSDSSTIRLTAGSDHIISQIQFSTKTAPQDTAWKQIFSFLSLACGRNLSADEEEEVRQCFSTSENQNTDVVSIKLDRNVFLLCENTEEQQYIIVWE